MSTKQSDNRHSACMPWLYRLCAPQVGIFWKCDGDEQASLMLPNPLWWIVGYGIVYPKRQLARLRKKLFPTPKKQNHCGNCGKTIETSFWGWCSIECLNALAERQESAV